MNDHLTILFKVYVFLYVDGKSKMTATLDKGFNIGKCINIFISETIKLTQPILPIDDYLMVMNKVFLFYVDTEIQDGCNQRLLSICECDHNKETCNMFFPEAIELIVPKTIQE
jgi:hypothetical protein